MDSQKRKKVLIITYYWPPAGGVAVQRWVKFAKYLKEYNWEPIIYTPKNPDYPMLDGSYDQEVKDIKVIKTKIWEPYHLTKYIFGKSKKVNVAGKIDHGTKKSWIKRAIFFIRGNFFIPDARAYWIRPSVRYLSQYIKEEKIEVVIASAPPLSCLVIAAHLRKSLPIKILLDFRDYWFFMDNVKDFQFTKSTLTKHEKLKSYLCNTCDSLIAVSSHLLDEFDTPPNTLKELIPNGFDEGEFQYDRSDFRWPGKFVLGHYGTLGSDRNYPILWKVLADLSRDVPSFKNDLQIRLVGNIDGQITSSLKEYDLLDNLEKSSFVPHDEIVKMMRNSCLLFLPINKNHSSKGRMTSKLFEYMAVNRPIIAISQDIGDPADMIKECSAGAHFLPYEEKTLQAFVLKMYNAYKNDEKWTNNTDEVSKYKRSELTKKLNDLLTTLSSQ